MSPVSRDYPTSVLIYCQHSVGLGHLVRSLAIARSLAIEHRVVVVSGGETPRGLVVPEGVEFVSLPAVTATDGRGSRLGSVNPEVTLEQVWAQRRDHLSRLLDALRPDVVMVELFPFGRRKFAGEIVGLLDQARHLVPDVLRVSSVRDILVDSKPNQRELDDQTRAWAHEYFDAVVVHADPRLVSLDETFRPSEPLNVALHYTGYVVPSPEAPLREAPSEPLLLVSAGGGKVGATLLRDAALAHRDYLASEGFRTRLICGPFAAREVVDELRELSRTTPGLTVDENDSHLCDSMARASVSLSQCGYNTALDIVRSGTTAIVVPYDLEGESEQLYRAQRLGERGLLQCLPFDQVTPQRLSEEVRCALGRRPTASALDLSGAETTRRIVGTLLAERRAPSIVADGVRPLS